MDLQRPSLKQVIEERIGPRSGGTDARPTWCCPFHVDANPSFGTIPSSDNERWKCFGCGESGDVFDFIALHDKRDLNDVLREHHVDGEQRVARRAHKMERVMDGTENAVPCRTSFASFASFAAPPATDSAGTQVPTLDPAAYHGIIGDFVRAVAPHTEADPAGILIQTLIAAGNMIGRGPHALAEADEHHANESCVLVGKSGKGRKGTSFGYVRLLSRAVDPAWEEGRVLSGASTGEGIIWAVRDPITKVNKNSVEEVTDEGVADKRLLLLMPEFAGLLKVLDRQGNTLSPVLREAFDGGNLNILTKNSPARATDAHVSMIGHITVDELRRYLTSTECANGFANRILWCYVQRSKMLPEGGKLDAGEVERLGQDLRARVMAARKFGEMGRTDAYRDKWHEVYADLTADRTGLFGAVTGRAEVHVLRIANLLAMLDGTDTRDVPHLEAALAVWRYCEESALFVFGDAIGDPVADEVLSLLRREPTGMARTEISSAFSRHKSSSRLDSVLSILQRHGHATCVKEPSGGGRPTERWFATSVLAAKEAKKAKEVPPDATATGLSALPAAARTPDHPNRVAVDARAGTNDHAHPEGDAA